MPSQKYDIIFGCDIIYEVSNYPDLLKIIEERLNPQGIAIIASKAYYYGNGGSIAEFKQCVENSNLVYHRLQNINTGMSNRREIFSLQHKT